MIMNFRDDYYFLSNFYPCEVLYDGHKYLSAEAAFQAQKTTDNNEKALFETYSASVAKRHGREVCIRDDWEKVKVSLMYDIVLAKFTSNPVLADRLLATGNETLAEGNTWGDTFWGVCNGNGKNMLGIILMKVRDALRIKETL